MTNDDRSDAGASNSLVVLLEGRPAGVIERQNNGTLRLRFHDDYLADGTATRLSVAMPPTRREHTDATITPWLWGLLPDNADVLSRWGNRFGVSTASPFPLLGTQVGHDCAGAVQFANPADVDNLVAGDGEVEWLDDASVAQRLRELRADSTSWLGRGFTGQFSLGGAQAKTALHRDGDRWGLPSGAMPTTHILKPAISGIEWQDLNEHLCLAAARNLGLTAARSEVVVFEDETAIAVQRYDRRRLADAPGRPLQRVHQEDLCQAMSVLPSRKYQSDGGPSVGDVAKLLRAVMPGRTGTDAVWRFADALALNWLVAGTDAHAKNYSLLLAGSQVRLAPLYDVASMLPYDDSEGNKLRLAMKVGGSYRLNRTDRPGTWAKAAQELNLPESDLAERVADLADRLPEAFAAAANEPGVTQLDTDFAGRLADAVAARAQRCRSTL